ncbi:FSR family fosmidomycin resistance protein-like MFS transporter [Saccharopolyspora erythraea NRRL 2338]|nr:FSR family fosmidomycin resistance protein-like MFS transporter [Saccharopolyspora erythraea NRRL 2338]QRK87166.1 MFS transporter [Saccharopolyspora erythraea]
MAVYRKRDSAAWSDDRGVLESDKKAVRLMAAGHACVDLYQGAVPAVVPFLVLERNYGYDAVSGIVMAATLLSSVVQPLFGALTDRHRLSWLIPVAMTTAGLGVALAGPAGSYPLTWLAIALSGLGVAAYHPESARLVRSVSRGDHLAMSWFSVGGNIGFALAPVIVAPLLSAGGLRATPWLLVPALLGAALTTAVLRSLSRPVAAAGQAVARRGSDDWPAFARLTAIVVFRSIVYIGLSAFVGLWAQQRVAGGETAGAVALFVLFAGGAVGTLLGGRLVQVWGRVRTLRIAYAASVPAVAGVVLVPGHGVYFFVAASAILLYVPFSLHVTLGQDYLPNRVGTAGGVTLGLAVSVGGVATPAVGAIAEHASLQVALGVLIAFPVLAWVFARSLSEPRSLESRSAGHAPVASTSD